jgi:hypothetical protein
MSEQPEIVTNPRSLLFGVGLTLVIAAFGAQISNWSHWITIGAGYTVGATLMCVGTWLGFRAYYAARSDNSQPPIEIIFEPLNPARKFWSLEGHTDALGRTYPPYWEHRVEIRNHSRKTLRNVMVTVERIGQLPQLPFSPPFKRPETNTCDLNPGCSELVRVNVWPHPKAQAGMPCGESAWLYGPIKVTASADDTPSAVKVFAFNYETDQMLFDVEVYK